MKLLTGNETGESLNMEKVSIITPSYNSSKFISATINSVLSQTVTHWEMIIVDDCSTDNSVEIIQSCVEKDSRIKLIELTRNSGAAVARNKAIEMAQGRYIAFLDSDDLWLPSKLEKQLAFMQKNNYPFIYTAYDKIDEEGEFFGHVGAFDKVNYFDMLKNPSIGCLTVIYDTNHFGKVYMPLIHKRQDFGLWLKLLKKTEHAYGLNKILAQYRVHNNSISANKIKAACHTWLLYRQIEELSLFQSMYYFSYYATKGLLRTKAPNISRKLGFLK
ncbi:MAG TPA: glycosyltransferase family 2 protein [Fusibacter sp.]|nr:glycosyltransferase family 2 protein [Fusibacter sp.]